MRVTISEHAKERMIDPLRLGCKPHKVQKIGEKAWNSTEPLSTRAQKVAQFDANAYKEIRFFCGNIYIFQIVHSSAILITVLNSKEPYEIELRERKIQAILKAEGNE